MAIRVGGTVVIDDSRNLTNIAQVNATTTNASVVCGTTVCGTLCGSLGAISASSLTGITASDQYICLIACETITAGSPVSTSCTCGVVNTKGGASNYCLGSPYGCTGENIAASCYRQATIKTSATALNFACNPNCFVSVMFAGGSGSCTGQNCMPHACIRTHCVSSSGAISSACLCCYNYGPCGTNALCCIRCVCFGVAGVGGWCDTMSPTLHGAMPVCSCTGSTGAIIVPVFKTSYCCHTTSFAGSCMCGIEFFFCYCTTTCTIALIRHCHGLLYSNNGDLNTNAVAYVTNDRQYLVVPFCRANTTCCGQDCACVCTGLYVKRLNDAMCLLSWTPAASCTGVSWKDVLPASCALLATNAIMGYGGTMPFTQGSDGWTLNYYDTCMNASTQTSPKIWAYRAVADNCYAMTNILCTPGCLYIPYNCGSAQCLACDGGLAAYSTAGQFAWDEGSCKKMITSLTSGNCVCAVRINCFCVSGTTLSQTSYSDGTTYCCNQNTWGRIFYNFIGSGYQGSENPSGYNLARGVYNNGTDTVFNSTYMLSSLAMYNSSVPLCYPCSCYIFSGMCTVLIGRQGCNSWATSGINADHSSCWNCWGGCYWVAAYAFKPSYGGGYVNAVTQCGSNGQGVCGAGLHGLNAFPFFNNSNTNFTSAVSGQVYPGTGCTCCTCSGMGSIKIGYCEATVCTWLGIAQCGNTAGGIVQVATLGMVDRTAFSTNLSSYAGSACCLISGFRCTIAHGTPCALNGLTIGYIPCGRLCNYAHSIVFRPFWDSGKGCYVTAIHGRTTMQDCSSA